MVCMDETLSYWLIPAEPTLAWFVQTVEKLAARYEAPTFVPHITLYAGAGAGIDAPAKVIQRALASAEIFSAQTMHPSGVSESDEFTKTLFVEFAFSDNVARFARHLRTHSAQSSNYELKPHASLLYKTLPDEERAALTKEIAMPFESVEFDRVQAMICPSPTRTAEDVRAWRLVHETKLG